MLVVTVTEKCSFANNPYIYFEHWNIQKWFLLKYSPWSMLQVFILLFDAVSLGWEAKMIQAKKL